MDKKVNLFIVGAPKAGTTSLFYYLSQHAEIETSKLKEPMFFCTDLYKNKEDKKLADYLSLFNLHTDKKYLLESSTWYLYSTAAAKNIYDYNANSKIIIILRNPLDLLCSLQEFRLFTGREDSKSLEIAISKEPTRLNGHGLPKNTDLHKNQYDYTGLIRFSEQIKRYKSYFKDDNICILNYDDLKKSTSDVMNTICDFLKIERINMRDIKTDKKNTGKINKSATFKKFTNNPPKIFRKFVRFFLSSDTRSKLYDYLVKINSKEKKTSRVEVSEEIKEIFDSEIIKLNLITKNQFRSWNNK